MLITYCKKNPALILAIISAIFGFVGFLLGKAYADGCRDTKVEAVTYGQVQLQDDVKDIKKDVSEQRVDIALLKQTVNETRSDMKDIKAWIKPSKEAFNGVQERR